MRSSSDPRGNPFRTRSMGLWLVGHHAVLPKGGLSNGSGRNPTSMLLCPRSSGLAPRLPYGYLLLNSLVTSRGRPEVTRTVRSCQSKSQGGLRWAILYDKHGLRVGPAPRLIPARWDRATPTSRWLALTPWSVPARPVSGGRFCRDRFWAGHPQKGKPWASYKRPGTPCSSGSTLRRLSFLRAS